MAFAPAVAQCLTELCIFENAVPQGAKPSGDLANLALWRREPALVERFSSMGLRYSRYVDDVYVSAKRLVTSEEKTFVVAQLHRLFVLDGLKIKRKKHELNSSATAMRVHRVSINAGRPSLAKDERNAIRAGVRELESSWSGLDANDRSKALARMLGRVTRLKDLHPTTYKKLIGRVRELATD
jgi:hypothetical protein